MKRSGVSCLADSIHAKNLCPYCQKSIVNGEEIAICNDCNSIHHQSCWNTGNCGSYHCRSDQPSNGPLKPDFAITKQEAQTVVLPPRGRMYTTESLADEVGQKQLKTNYLAIIGMCCGIICFLVSMKFAGGTKPISEGEAFVFLGIILGGTMTALISAISLAAFQKTSSFWATLHGLIGLLTTGFAMIMAIYAISARSQEREMAQFQFQADQVKDFIQRATPTIRGPLMANVHLLAKGSYGREYMGSGVILKSIEDDTYIISNLHVITGGKGSDNLEKLKNETKVMVTFFTGEQKPAELIWHAPDEIDLAILRVSTPRKLIVSTKIQPNRELSIGQKVFAIGNPLGLNWSYTQGVISGIRAHHVGNEDITVFQMQTPLNPGNSGGGLYDEVGYLVGINTWIYAKNRSEGLNFSIDINDLLKFTTPALRSIILSQNKGEKNVSQAEAPPGGLQ